MNHFVRALSTYSDITYNVSNALVKSNKNRNVIFIIQIIIDLKSEFSSLFITP